MSLPENHPRLAKRPYSAAELIADGFVHAVAIVAGYRLRRSVRAVAWRGDLSDGFALAIYAAGFFLLFGFSCAYNMTPPSQPQMAVAPLRPRLDLSDDRRHLYGASVATARRRLAWALAAFVWAVALGGAAVKSLLPGKFDRASLVVYLALGWVGDRRGRQLVAPCRWQTLVLILIGGLFYSVGVLFYRWHSLKFQNAIWHASSPSPRAANTPASRRLSRTAARLLTNRL